MRFQGVVGLTFAFVLLGGVDGRAADYAGHTHHRHAARWHHRAAIGDCVRTRVEAIGSDAGGASAPVIRYRDGVIQEYDADMLGQRETQPGDPIKLCLVSFTRDCGDAELRGRTYATGNLRTGAAWTSADVRSSCVAR